MRIGSLFSGFGGLDMGVQQVLGGTVAWHVEFDDAPSKILAHHWPDIPNYGDITAVDWAEVEPVDVLTGGFPCQDVSLAGARAGLTDGTRSGLWSEFAKAISALRPQLVVIENVRGLLSAKTIEEANETDSDMEPSTGSVGEPERVSGSVLNAFGRVLGDLAVLGYDAEWVGVRAADAGAPHGRYRVFIVAHPTSDTGRLGNRNDVPAGRGTDGREPHAGSSVAENADISVGDQRGIATPGQTESGRSWADAGRRSRTPTADTCGDEPERRGIGGDVGSTPATGEGTEEERERIRHTASDSGSTVADPNHPGCSEHRRGVTVQPEQSPTEHDRSHTAWGAYEPAIRRWQQVLGRTAPSPTNPDGKNGSHRLSAQFVEWMMGLPAGHVTDPAIGLTRNQQLKALGNGVVPQQAALALRMLGVTS